MLAPRIYFIESYEVWYMAFQHRQAQPVLAADSSHKTDYVAQA